MEELKINVGVPGAAESAAALKGVAAAEQGVGAAAAGATGGINQAAAAKGKASEAANELHMRNRTLLNSLSQLGPEFGIAANAVNELVNKTTTAGMALGLLGVAVGAAAYAYSRFSETQKESRREAEQVLKALGDEYEARLKVVQVIERAARAKGGAGGQAVSGLLPRAFGLAPEGVGPEDVERAATLAAKAKGRLSDDELKVLMLQVSLGREPEKGSDRSKVSRLLKGDLAGLTAEMATVDPALRRTLTRQTQLAATGFTGPAVAEAAMQETEELALRRGEPGRGVNTKTRRIESLLRQATQMGDSAAAQELAADLEATPELGGMRFRQAGFWEVLLSPMATAGKPGAGYAGSFRKSVPGEGGQPLSIIVQNLNTGNQYNDSSNPAGRMGRSPLR